MPRELNVISTPTSGGSDACTYMWACAICDENESCQKDKEGHSRWLVAKRMERIEYKVLVMSNKGGVGKSTLTLHLAGALRARGLRIAILDADFNGPSQARMAGVQGAASLYTVEGATVRRSSYVSESQTSGITVYGGGGLGPSFVHGFHDRDSGFAWQYFGGVRYAISDKIDLGLKYRYFNSGVVELFDDPQDFAGNGDSAVVTPIFKGKFRSRNLLATLTYNFR